MKSQQQTFYEFLLKWLKSLAYQSRHRIFLLKKTEIKKQILEVNNEAVKFFNKMLLESPEASKARDYLFKRNITEEVIEKFNIVLSKQF